MANSAPLLTVAIPTYNGATHLAETLLSILNQECPPFDILVSDDYSDDDTVEMVRAFAGKRARIVINPERLGLAGNWNQCMALSQTPWVSIFHQDDVMLPGHLAWVLQKIANLESMDPPIGLIAGPVRMIDERSQPVPESVVPPGGVPLSLYPTSIDFLEFPPDVEFSKRLWWNNPLRCSAVIINRLAHESVGGFDPSYKYVVDWEFWLRISREWTFIWKRFGPTVLVRWHAGSETHRLKTGISDLEETERLLVHVESLNRGDREFDLRRRTANQVLARAYLNRTHDAIRSGGIELARTCLRRAWERSPRQVLTTVATDPRFCVQVGTLTAAPGLAGRWFSKVPDPPVPAS